ncbi:methyl-accepting chemotaxis protein [Methylobacillus sp. Pita1]|uniref:methyl-accepting chemotaxis protein n=1 Tax=Methylobacillus sp. Pita1 TaxID=3382642 RepID=UPI0038B49392
MKLITSLLAWICPALSEPAQGEGLQPQPPAVGAGQASRHLAALALRLGHLMRQLLNTESTQSARFTEVESRLGAMTAEVGQTTARMRHSLEEAEALRSKSQEDFSLASSEISQGLLGLEQALASKLSRVNEVVQGLERIGRELELIAINAAIQAAHAGEAGRSFSVVAEHVRELARHTVSNSNEVSLMLDFSDFQQQLIGFGHSSRDNVERVDRDTAQAFGTVQQTFREISASMQTLLEHGNVIETMHQLDRGSYAAQRRKVGWAQQLATDLAGLETCPDLQLGDALSSLLRADGGYKPPGYDRLADIQSRGVLRVAIEPAFKGLSFRLRPGEPLRGLDVEYATAFARAIGVEVEFIEHPWDQCVELLHIGRERGEPEADVVWSALPPSASYHQVAYSEAYTYLHYMLARRKGDQRIGGLSSLEGKVLGCINDPAAFATLEAAGLRWSKHGKAERGAVRLANLIGYTDQSIIHDALASGKVDAFAVDQPIFAWACNGQDSPWHGRIELLQGNLAASPWYYVAAVADDPSSYTLLREINRFIREFRNTPERQALEKRWQFHVVEGHAGYRDEPGKLRGEEELYQDWLARMNPQAASLGARVEAHA